MSTTKTGHASTESSGEGRGATSAAFARSDLTFVDLLCGAFEMCEETAITVVWSDALCIALEEMIGDFECSVGELRVVLGSAAAGAVRRAALQSLRAAYTAPERAARLGPRGDRCGIAWDEVMARALALPGGAAPAVLLDTASATDETAWCALAFSLVTMAVLDRPRGDVRALRALGQALSLSAAHRMTVPDFESLDIPPKLYPAMVVAALTKGDPALRAAFDRGAREVAR